MKKTLMSLLSLLALSSLFILTSCQKEQMGNGTQFRATMEGCTAKDGKTALNGNSLNWVEGDQIVVYGDVGCGLYTATPQTPATVAVFDNVNGETGNAPFRAYYPSTLTTDGVNITLPATQTYVEGSMNEFPMYTESANNQLSFRNLCGVLKLHLTKANTNISAITITTNTEANGTYSIDYNNGDPVLTLVGNGTNATTLECATAQTITNGKDFYIYLPATVDSVKSIMLTTDNGMTCTKTVKASSHIGIDRNTITDITLGENDLNFVELLPEGSLSGLFSVSATQQVRFSKGNLQYQASTGTWRFAEHQYDYIGTDNSNISSNYTGWIDLFGWGTGNNPTLHTTSYSDYSTFVDWGINPISNGGNQSNIWRTLTSTEWDYLFNGRPNAYYKRGAGNVNGIQGEIVLPDEWALPEDLSFTAGQNGWTVNSYTYAQWNEMEANGAIFIPKGGYRGGITLYMNVGYYWSSTPYEMTHAYYVWFNGTSLNAVYHGINPTRPNGFSVRLVHDNL